MFRGFLCSMYLSDPMPDLSCLAFKYFIPSSGLSFLLLVILSRSKWWYPWPTESFLKNNRINIKVKCSSRNNPLSTAPALPLHTDRIQHYCSTDSTSGGKNGLKWANSWLLLLAYWEASVVDHSYFTVKSLLRKDLNHSFQRIEREREKETCYWVVKVGRTSRFLLRVFRLWRPYEWSTVLQSPTGQILPSSHFETAESSRLTILYEYRQIVSFVLFFRCSHSGPWCHKEETNWSVRQWHWETWCSLQCCWVIHNSLISLSLQKAFCNFH